MERYEIIRGADNEIEFQGLRGKYVTWLFVAGAASLFLGLVMFILLPSMAVAGLIAIGGVGTVIKVCYDWNKKYGRWGMEKEQIRKNLPTHIVMRPTASIRRRKE